MGQEVLPRSEIRSKVGLCIERRCGVFVLLLSLVSPLVSGRLPRKNLQKSSRKSRLWVKRHFHQLENCLLVNFDVIEKMHAIPDLDCPSKIAQISSEIRGFRHVIFNNFRVFEALGEKLCL